HWHTGDIQDKNIGLVSDDLLKRRFHDLGGTPRVDSTNQGKHQHTFVDRHNWHRQLLNEAALSFDSALALGKALRGFLKVLIVARDDCSTHFVQPAFDQLHHVHVPIACAIEFAHQLPDV